MLATEQCDGDDVDSFGLWFRDASDGWLLVTLWGQHRTECSSRDKRKCVWKYVWLCFGTFIAYNEGLKEIILCWLIEHENAFDAYACLLSWRNNDASCSLTPHIINMRNWVFLYARECRLRCATFAQSQHNSYARQTYAIALHSCQFCVQLWRRNFAVSCRHLPDGSVRLSIVRRAVCPFRMRWLTESNG